MEKNTEKQNKQRTHLSYILLRIKELTFLFFKEILSIGEVDYQQTLSDIEKDMAFRGHTAWILMFSILIASIGLNANSTAVIIGAMLISPLMGPIVAIGTAIGIYDWKMLQKAIKYLLVAVSISLITSAIYFWLTPLKEAHSELLARTKPTILDVMIALFGGFAGSIVGAKREKSNVIPGVAIATALMPPLCTAGYGIATAKWNFFLGAMYLFFINSVFISIATFITVKYLKFPKKEFINKQQEKRIKLYITILAIIVILPSAIIFFNVIKEARFKTNTEHFITKETSKFPNSQLIDKKIIYGDTAYINLFFIGEPLKNEQIKSLQKKLKKYGLLNNKSSWWQKIMLPDTTILQIFQAKDNTEAFKTQLANLNQKLKDQIKNDLLQDIYKQNLQLIQDKEKRIEFLENQLIKLTSDTIPIRQIAKELSVEYDKITKFAFAKSIMYKNDTTIDTIPILLVHWKPGYSKWYRKKQETKLSKWLQYRLNLDTLRILEF